MNFFENQSPRLRFELALLQAINQVVQVIEVGCGNHGRIWFVKVAV